MKKTLLTLLALLFILTLKAQKRDTVTISYRDSSVSTTSVEEPPSFPGGMKEFYRYLAKTVRYPASAREHNTQGKVIVSVIIEMDGSISNAKVIRHVSEDIDKEALRVINQSPKWLPGTRNGHPFPTSYMIPISFTLAD
jgi:protein TonB